MRLLFIFIDGVGLGGQQANNPFVYTESPGLSKLLDGKALTKRAVNHEGVAASLLSLDATLGVGGLPQSATGQATIFTGINAAAHIGRHLRGFPNRELRTVIAEKSLFKQLRRMGYRVAFANAYRPPFFDLLRRGLPGNRYSCSTLITYYGGLPFYSLEDIQAGRALYMDITNEVLQRMNFEVPLLTPEQGARQLINISRNFDFCLFEYFLSDLAGHLADPKEAGHIVEILDQFIATLAAQIDPQEEMLVVTSDHGNLEDVNRPDHTMNRVPLLLVGDLCLRRGQNEKAGDLTDILPLIKAILAADVSGSRSTEGMNL